jgi:drug/metabolite transporter (DMT)-like permease
MKYSLSVLLGAASYGILSTIVVLAYGRGFQLGEVVGSQLLTGFVLACALAWFTKWKEKRAAGLMDSDQRGPRASAYSPLTWKQRLLLMAAGMPTAITGLLYYSSLKYIPASLAIILLFQFTWIGVLIQAISERKRPNRVMLFTLAVLFAGTWLAAGIVEQGMGRLHIAGMILGLLSAVSYSIFLLVSGKAVPSAHPAYRSMWMIGGGLVLVFVLFPPSFLVNGLLFGSPLMGYGFLLGLFGAFIPPVLFAIGVPRIGEGLAGVLGAVELPVAVLMSSMILHEQVSLLQWAGVAIVLLGVAIPELMKRRASLKENLAA